MKGFKLSKKACDFCKLLFCLFILFSVLSFFGILKTPIIENVGNMRYETGSRVLTGDSGHHIHAMPSHGHYVRGGGVRTKTKSEMNFENPDEKTGKLVSFNE